MTIRPILPSFLALLVALPCQPPTVRAQDDWELHRERYAHWLDNQWQDAPVVPANQAPPTTIRWLQQPAPQQVAYRHHAWYGLTGGYFPRAIAPTKFVAAPLPGTYHYSPLLDDDFCNLFDLDPLDCTCY